MCLLKFRAFSGAKQDVCGRS